MTNSDGANLREEVISTLKNIYDPEIPVNIYDLGLIYKVEVDDQKKALIEMTLTSPNCPAAVSLPGEVESKVKSLEGIVELKLDIIWDPPWGPDKMSDEAKLQLNLL